MTQSEHPPENEWQPLTAEECREAAALLEALIRSALAALPDPPDEAAACAQWEEQIARPAMLRRLQTLPLEQYRLVVRYLEDLGVEQVVREVADERVDAGRLERNPYDPDEYGPPGTIWPAPAPS